MRSTVWLGRWVKGGGGERETFQAVLSSLGIGPGAGRFRCLARFPSRQPSPRAARPQRGPSGGELQRRRLSSRCASLDHTAAGPAPAVIQTNIYDKRSDSTKITTHLDHISHCKPTSGPNWSNRWTKLGPIDGRTEEGCRLAARVWITRPQVSHLQSNTSVSFSSGWHRISCSISITVIENHLNSQQDSILGL